MKFVCGLMAISHRLLSSSGAVLTYRHRRPPPLSVSMSKSTPPHFNSYIHRFPAQNLSTIYQLQYPHFTTGRCSYVQCL